MKTLALGILALTLTTASMDACVTYSPSTGTYTVDPSGCVDHGRQKPQKQKKSQPKASKPSKGKKK